ncbi:DUF6402 family protein [Luteibacter sp.]|jgi:hypothetical protein|uniref:DUF6402 family protein n=1 Tax=Luteibacter sp. TaxID=1886636 RepID=UPI002F404349
MYGNHWSREDAETVELIKSIPTAMRRMGWTVSAQLMERWLQTPAWVLPTDWKKRKTSPNLMPSFTQIDQNTVRMSWARSYQRLRSMMDELRTAMANEPARKELRTKTAKIQLSPDWSIFGSQTYSAFRLDGLHQSNAREFGGFSDPLDDMYGSLGMATLKVALIGEAKRDPRSQRVTIRATHAGYYIRDTYDFNGFQFLGTWTKTGVLHSIQPPLPLTSHGVISHLGKEPVSHVFNHDFESYRRVTGLGGDFIVYSDVVWEPVDMTLELDPPTDRDMEP